MKRLSIQVARRPSSPENKANVLPAGDVLPAWSNLPLDAKLPMVSNPKGSVHLCTTKLGQPKHRSKQTFDFDLRDPYMHYISCKYYPLHDPHLKTHFCSKVMKKHLVKNGFILDDGRIVCNLKEFNQYRQYLRQICLLEIARERQRELSESFKKKADENEKRRHSLEVKVSRGVMVRRRMQQLKEYEMGRLNSQLSSKSDRLGIRMKELEDAATKREERKRQELEHRLEWMTRHQTESNKKNKLLMKKWQQKDRACARRVEERERQRILEEQLKSEMKWYARKLSQREKLEQDAVIMRREEEARIKNIEKRERMMEKRRDILQKKLEDMKNQKAIEKQKRDDQHAKRLARRLASGDFRIWSKKKSTKPPRPITSPFQSVWKFEEVLKKLSFSSMYKKSLSFDILEPPHIETMEPSGDKDHELLQEKAKEIVQSVFDKIRQDVLAGLLDIPCEAQQSRSVRFLSTAETVPPMIQGSVEGTYEDFRPVEEHVLTPIPTKDVPGDEMDQTSALVISLLMRLLDDLNNGKLGREEILKLSSYCMDIIQTCDEKEKDEEALEVSSSSSQIANEMVKFTLSRIVDDIHTGRIHEDDLAAFTISMLDAKGASGDQAEEELSDDLTISDTDLEEFIEETIRQSVAPGDDQLVDESTPVSPICDAMLDSFLIKTLKALLKDLKSEALSREQVDTLAKAVQDEMKELGTEEDRPQPSPAVQDVLENLLDKMQTGGMDMGHLYQVVLAIVYAYEGLQTASHSDFETRITDMVRGLFDDIEKKISGGSISVVDTKLFHEAREKLVRSTLNLNAIEKISSSLVSTVSPGGLLSEAPSSEISIGIIEDVLQKAKEKVQSVGDEDKCFLEQIGKVASVVVETDVVERIDGPSAEEDSAKTPAIFVNLLDQLKQSVNENKDIPEYQKEELGSLIQSIRNKQLSPTDLNTMAATVAQVETSTSQSSFAADMVVRDVLKQVQDDILVGEVDNNRINAIVSSLVTAYRSIRSRPVTPDLIDSLTQLLQSVLEQVTFKVQCGEFDENDIDELAKAVRHSLNKTQPAVDEAAETKFFEQFEAGEGDPRQRFLLAYITKLLMDLEAGKISKAEALVIGNSLVDLGKTIVLSTGEPVQPPSPSPEEISEEVVDEVIKKLQREIDSGELANESLKAITKSILIVTEWDRERSPLPSDIADVAVGLTLRDIYEEVEKGTLPQNLPSVRSASMCASVSASTTANNVVLETLKYINDEIVQKGLPPSMISSVATSIVSLITETPSLGDGTNWKDAAINFEKVRKTLPVITECLKQDKVNYREAQKIFSVILEKYREYVLTEGWAVEDDMMQIQEGDQKLVMDLVQETLNNIQRSLSAGKIGVKDFSISPVRPSTEDCSVFAIKLIEQTLVHIKSGIQKGDLKHEILSVPSTGAPPMSLQQPVTYSEEVTDFIIEVVAQLLSGLQSGQISKCSIAQFFYMVAPGVIDEKNNLEDDAENNLKRILLDIQEKRSSSSYVKKIIETFLSANKDTENVFSDPLKALELILINVSSEVLTRFVRSTIHSILHDIKEGHIDTSLKVPSTYVLRTASSLVVDDLVKQVLSQVKSNLKPNMPMPVEGRCSKEDFERTASKLRLSPLQGAISPGRGSVTTSRQNIDPVMSRQAEDVVLETLHNIVSNLRVEEQTKPERLFTQAEGNDRPDEVEDYVLQTIQNIVEDMQDKRSFADVANLSRQNDDVGQTVQKSASATERTEAATAYVKEVIQATIAEMLQERSTKETQYGIEHHQSRDLERYVLETLESTLAGPPTTPNRHVQLEDQSEEIVTAVIAALKQTIDNVHENKYNQGVLLSLIEALSKFLQDDDMKFCEDGSTMTEWVIEMLTLVLQKIDEIGIDQTSLQNIAAYLAAMGTDRGEDSPASVSQFVSMSSVASSVVGNLVHDVVRQITEHVSETRAQESGELQNEETAENKGILSTDINTNRKLSASTMKTEATADTSTEETIHDSSNEDIAGKKRDNADQSVNQTCSFLKQLTLIEDAANTCVFTENESQPEGSVEIQPNMKNIPRNKKTPDSKRLSMADKTPTKANKQTLASDKTPTKGDKSPATDKPPAKGNKQSQAKDKTPTKDNKKTTPKSPKPKDQGTNTTKETPTKSTKKPLSAQAKEPVVAQSDLSGSKLSPSKSNKVGSKKSDKNIDSRKISPLYTSPTKGKRRSSAKSDTPAKAGPFEVKSVCGSHSSRVRIIQTDKKEHVKSNNE